MTKFKIVALTKPVMGKEAEFHEWYENTHIPEMLLFPGMKKAQRYKQVTTLMGEEANPWLAIFDVELNDSKELLDEMKRAADLGRTTSTDAVDMDTVQEALFEAKDGGRMTV